MGAIDIVGLSYARDETHIIRNIDLHIPDGDFSVVVGPSGSGKTTLLRLIAGLDAPTAGTVEFDGIDITDLPTRQRDVAMVFEQATFLPHRSVRRNIGFGLEVRKTPDDEITRRVEAEARAMHITEDLERMPRQLSAGHKGLAEIARAMVRMPAVFLLDEPLAQIDAHHRAALRRELKEIQAGYNVTTVMVTNDPEEAMAIADLLVVIEDGRVVQVGPPARVYREPADIYVAQFVGSYPMSLLSGTVRRSGREAVVKVGGDAIPTWAPSVRSGQPVFAGWRVEDVAMSGEGSWRVEQVHFIGDRWLISAKRDGEEVVILSDISAEPGTTVGVDLAPEKMHLFEDPSGLAIQHPL